MATLKVCVRKQRADGIYPVYIRVTQNRKTGYIKTDKMVNSAGLNGTEITDPYVMKFCMERIIEYMNRLNKVDTFNWNVNEVISYLTNGDNDISFSEYARKHRDKMINNGQERNAKNYTLAVQHMERFAGTNNVMFSQLTSSFVERWIESLKNTHRAKEMYPVCVRQIFKAALIEFNDYDNGIIRIKTNPWMRVEIPTADKAEKLAITPEECREFFSAPLPESKFKSPIPELGRDVAMMVLCLGGINTIDLYNLRKQDYYNGVIHYQRAKTKKFRADGAYIEMRVPPILHPIMEKYLSSEKDDHLFVFHQRHSTADSFNANVNIGIKRICESMGIAKENRYSCYTFRHTWGTIAQNDCGASLSEVAFGMNHSGGHEVTRGYVKIDFSPAWELNEKVVELVFFTDKKSSRTTQKTEVFERFSSKQMIRGEVYYRGVLQGEVQDIGFNNVDEVIDALKLMVPDDIPSRSVLQYKITNVDKKQTAVYERLK